MIRAARRAPRLLTSLALAAALSVASLAAFGQTRASEEALIPWDSGGHVERMDARLRERAALWPGLYDGFVEARLLRADDGTTVLQVLRRDHGQTVQERVALEAAEVESLRTLAGAAIVALAEENAQKADARGPFLTATTLTGVGFYSWGVPIGAKLEGKSAVGAGMLCAGAAFAIPYAISSQVQITPGMAHLASSGLSRGAATGALLHRAIAGPQGDGDSGIAAAVVGSVAEAAVGFEYARRFKLDPGRAHLIEAGGDLGTLAGVETEIAFQINRPKEETLPGGGTTTSGSDRSTEYVTILAGKFVGHALGAWYGARADATWGDAEVFRTASLLCQLTALTLWDQGTENKEAITGAVLGASLVGPYVGHRLTRGTDFRPTPAVLVDLSTIAGGALGMAGVFLLAQDDPEREQYLLAGTTGALAGFALSYAGFRGKSARGLSGVDVGVVPVALADREVGRERTQVRSVRSVVRPGVGFTARF